MRYQFDWNPQKEQQNIRKHGISFRQAATIFRDPNQLSIYDQAHSKYEDRWITIGLDNTGVLRVVVHTFEEIDKFSCKIRIISARKATNNEARQYQKDH
ncbi:protein of unknown function DUF497 [Stanieria cyanosphaera PCC 7437]|uniref:BrnT family toxin n=1 Tax=Stanieria cyanosphaera (strain ATCC 29371 / PCC 7437) TaxID=111780 RepID=K9XVV0_STAC7|nr:BrnT family toxin [Stanieria cyanosphaera]AFZ36658.1 protein of unknown function DUF497 [Stanieria cyanosphaera PCC 7437]